MATTGSSLAIAVGIYAIIALILFILFSWCARLAGALREALPHFITPLTYAAAALAPPSAPRRWRNSAGTKKFYAPKRYIQQPGHQQPPEIRGRFGSWVPQVGGWGEVCRGRCCVAGCRAGMKWWGSQQTCASRG